MPDDVRGEVGVRRELLLEQLVVLPKDHLKSTLILLSHPFNDACYISTNNWSIEHLVGDVSLRHLGAAGGERPAVLRAVPRRQDPPPPHQGATALLKTIYQDLAFLQN